MSAQRASVKALAKLERKKLQVEAMGEKKRAEEEGEDLERKKNWEYTIEDSEKWEKKTARKDRRSGFQFSSKRFFIIISAHWVSLDRLYLFTRISHRLRRCRSNQVQESKLLSYPFSHFKPQK